jgi:hypothetical protein
MNQTNITEFYIILPTLEDKSYSLSCNIYYSKTNSDYLLYTKNYTQLRSLDIFAPNIYTYPIIYQIIVKNTLSQDCNDLCSLCLSDNINVCIVCKYGYSLIGDDKYCFTEEGTVSSNQFNDIYKSLLNNMEEQRNQIIKQDNAIFQLSTLEEQQKNKNPYVSSVDLGQCESLLRSQEGLADEEDFLMVKVDIKNKDLSATYVQYEIYNPTSLEIVSLDVCDNIAITIQTPVDMPKETESLYSNLDQQGYNLFDLNDSFYNDICSTYTADNGADMIIKDRKEIIFDKNTNIYLCQKDCTFMRYNKEYKRAQCECNIQKKEKITDITKISFDSKKFEDSFYTVLKNSNFLVMKCFKLAFSLKGQKKISVFI